MDEPWMEQQQYAYITFADSMAANRAYELNRSKFVVEPADTWHQPVVIGEIADELAPVADTHTNESLLVLNDDCLYKIFEFCDLMTLSNLNDVCQRLRTLTNERKARDISMKLKISPTSNLATLRQLLRYVGRNLHDLLLEFDFDYKPKNLQRILYKVAQYCDGNIEKLSVYHLLLTADILSTLRPLLRRIKTFKVWNYNECIPSDYDIDLSPFRVNLEKLSIRQNALLRLCATPWDKLESLSILENADIERFTFELICRNNPQLKRLNLTFNYFYMDIEHYIDCISMYLKKIEKLSLENASYTIISSHPAFLLFIPNLRELKLTGIYRSEFGCIVEIVKELKQLESLKLQVYVTNVTEPHGKMEEMEIKSIGQNLVKLKTFHLEFFNFPTRLLLDFVRMRPSLDEIGIKTGCDIEHNDTVQTQFELARAINFGKEPERRLDVLINPFDEFIIGRRCISVLTKSTIAIRKYVCGKHDHELDI